MSAPIPSIDSQENWTRSDRYHNSFLITEDPVLDKVTAHTKANDLPDIAVSPSQGKFFYLIAKSILAKRVLEVGTLGAYSTIWFARAVPEDGEVVSLELEEKHVKVSRENIATAGLSSKAKVIQGAALDSLKALPSDPKFDLVFIDADKQNNFNYFIEAKRLVRCGGVIIVDNVGRKGLVGDPSFEDPFVEGVRTLLTGIQNDPDVEASTIHTVGEKGMDGFLYAIRK